MPKKLSQKNIEQLNKLHADKNIHKKISDTLKKKYASGEIIHPLKGTKRLDLSERNKLKKGVASWNKGITGQEYMSHFKDIEKWKQNHRDTAKKKGKEYYIERGKLGCLAQSKLKISKAEIKLKEYFINKNIYFIEQYNYKFGLADFYLPNYNMIIECYGIYWHNLPNYVARDKIKNEYLVNQGFILKILWSEDIMRCTNVEELLIKNNIIL